ncbi:hypothetical protein KGF57_001667 [Candida theae]|uniref:Uncharacterized protein n=1 Tax=Candida theae TaxID=1198502 RepID=A0AAD5BGI4_9ASCO|nr:uncharacterized protein KGF57_001667 [Candida theae]KAI5961542.1 hypothetical protein KGF57_001667 [Candida theae]
MVLNIFQRREEEAAAASARHEELQKSINANRRQQQQPRSQMPVASNTLLPSPQLQKQPLPKQGNDSAAAAASSSSSSFPTNASKRRTYISHRINLPIANKSGSQSPRARSKTQIPTISETATTKSGSSSPQKPEELSEFEDENKPSSRHTTVTGTPTLQLSDSTAQANLKRGASPKESEVAKKTQISNEVLNQRRARRMRARSKPSATKAVTRRQLEKRNSVASRESKESREKIGSEEQSEPSGLQNKSPASRQSPELTKSQQQMRAMIEQQQKRYNMHSGRPINNQSIASKPRYTLPYPVSDDIISIIITDETDETEEGCPQQHSITEEPHTGNRQSQFKNEEGSAIPSEFEPIHSRSFHIGNIPRNYTYSPESPALQSAVQSRTYSPRESSRTSFTPTTSHDGRFEVHNDTLQRLTGESESSIHNTLHSHSSPMQPTSSEQSTYHMASEEFAISATDAVACILERTGSNARGSRRGQRYEEIRRKQRSQRSQTRSNPEGTIPEEPSNQDTAQTSSIPIENPPLRSSSSTPTDINSQLQRHSSLSRRSTIEDTRARIIARLNQRVDPTMYPMEASTGSPHLRSSNAEEVQEEAPPPLDEYADLHDEPPSTPPYRERLHKKVDLISFDPRYVTPVLRINKRLIKTPTNLRKTIRKLIQLQIVPEEIDLWKIDRIEDARFYHVLPQLLNGEDAQNEVRAMNDAVRVAHERTELEYESEIQRAIAISLEEQTQRQLFHGFRYNGPSRNRGQDCGEATTEETGEESRNDSPVSGEEPSDASDVFINVDEAMRIWQQQEGQGDDHHLQPHVMPGSFNYLLPARTNSSVSSYMTAA